MASPGIPTDVSRLAVCRGLVGHVRMEDLVSTAEQMNGTPVTSSSPLPTNRESGQAA